MEGLEFLAACVWMRSTYRALVWPEVFYANWTNRGELIFLSPF